MLPLVVLAVTLAQGSGPSLTVSAAISLTEALEEAATAYRAYLEAHPSGSAAEQVRRVLAEIAPEAKP